MPVVVSMPSFLELDSSSFIEERACPASGSNSTKFLELDSSSFIEDSMFVHSRLGILEVS